MRILVLGINYAPEAIGIAVYTSGLCRDLAAMGHEVRVVTAKPYYPDWKVDPAYRGGWRRVCEDGVDLTRCPLYVPARPSGAKRLIHHVSFAMTSLVPMIRAAFSFRPDAVFTTAPSLLAAPVAWLAAKLSGAGSWVHVQDFEADAAVATGLIGKGSTIGKIARGVQGGILRRFDRISSISPEMCARLTDYDIAPERVVEFRNWAAIDKVRPIEGISVYRAEWGIVTPHGALYSGNIANKQGIEIVIEAADRLKHRSDLNFVVCGQGPNRAALEEQARPLPNIQFADLQPTVRLGDLLGLATVHLLPQKADAADLVLPSKLTNMLASGRPVVATAAPGTGLFREVEGCGVLVSPGDGAAFAAAIERLIDNPEEWRQAAAAARARAEEVWNPARITRGFADRLEELVAERRRGAAPRVRGGAERRRGMTKLQETPPFEEKMYPESGAGGFSHRDCTVAFYSRVDALLEPHMRMLNLGAGRGANIEEDRSAFRRKLQTFRGRVAHVIGIDLDPVVMENPDIDEAHIIKIGEPYPIADESVDIIVSDHVLEHVANPQEFAAEIDRVLKPGGWFCARTPTKWGYIGIGARAVPNALHVRFLERLQPERKAEDVFPVVYRMNSLTALRKSFPAARWRHFTYGFNGDPGYHANSRILFKLVETWGWLMPRHLSAKFHVFLQKN